jgi:hypothetical protein
MEITEIKTGIKKKVEITTLRKDDIKRLPKSRYSFDWSKVDKSATIFILNEVGSGDILGAIAILKFPDEFRYEIKLLAVSRENVGSKKIYEGIAGCLMAYACKECLKENGELACVSLVPKTKLKPHYIKKYGMEDAGWQIFLAELPLLKMINTYYL